MVKRVLNNHKRRVPKQREQRQREMRSEPFGHEGRDLLLLEAVERVSRFGSWLNAEAVR